MELEELIKAPNELWPRLVARDGFECRIKRNDENRDVFETLSTKTKRIFFLSSFLFVAASTREGINYGLDASNISCSAKYETGFAVNLLNVAYVVGLLPFGSARPAHRAAIESRDTFPQTHRA